MLKYDFEVKMYSPEIDLYNSQKINKALSAVLCNYGYHIPETEIGAVYGADRPSVIKMLLQKHKPTVTNITDCLINCINAEVEAQLILV